MSCAASSPSLTPAACPILTITPSTRLSSHRLPALPSLPSLGTVPQRLPCTYSRVVSPHPPLLSSPLHVHVCATAPSTTAASPLSFAPSVKYGSAATLSPPLPTPPGFQSMPHVIRPIQSILSNRAVGLPHCHTRRHPEPPAHQSPRPIQPDWSTPHHAQLTLQRARLPDRILLRPTVPGSCSARLPSGGLHDILLPLDFARTTSLARKLC